MSQMNRGKEPLYITKKCQEKQYIQETINKFDKDFM